MGKKVTHIITGLGKGGAETMLYQIIKFRSTPSLEYKVISLGGASFYEDRIRELGVCVEICPISKNPFSSMYRIVKNAKGSDVLCCWMMHANLVGYFAAKLAGVKRVIWCVRHSNTGRAFAKARSVRIDSICARLSSKVEKVVYNGNRARKAYEALGFCREKGIVLDNGCDCLEYAPNPEARGMLLKELGIAPGKKLLLSVARNHPIKDIPTFVHAFAIFHKNHPEAIAVMCGSGVEEKDQMLELCREVGLKPHEDVFLLGQRHDVPNLLAACDLYVLHSAGEAFPNTLLQAMSVSCLCISTDVGDARRIMDDDRFIIRPQQPEEMAAKMEEVMAMTIAEQKAVGERSRRRVQTDFNIRNIVKKYEEQYS